MIPLIALEEHYVSSAVTQAQKVNRYASFPPHIPAKLKEVHDKRIEDLNNGKISLQVISHGPGIRPATLCTAANDELASAISENPTRLAGFAMLPMDEPLDAAKELERCAKELHFVGALVDNHVNGDFYDDDRFWPVFQKAEELNLPIYIHPSFPADKQHYEGNYSDKIALALSAFGWGWHSETALSILKLFASGFFDRFPKIKILIGHMGEMIPFQFERIISTAESWGVEARIQRSVEGEYLDHDERHTTDISHVLYSVDYPFSSNEKGLAFVEEVQKSGLMSEDDFEKFAYRNAEDLLGVKAN
ncbi:metal-dependent hydrolase [Penicillium sp. IBT 35674x]|nr:metal-dependent hydrolase [Penicillium sp. IBT 35674x]